jgi:hypothetical protein
MFAIFVSSSANTSVHVSLTANLTCRLRRLGLQAGAFPVAFFVMSLMDRLTSVLVVFFVLGIPTPAMMCRAIRKFAQQKTRYLSKRLPTKVVATPTRKKITEK